MEALQGFVEEGYSGKDTKRPEYIRMTEDARRRRFKVLLVWKLDYLSRSTKGSPETPLKIIFRMLWHNGKFVPLC